MSDETATERPRPGLAPPSELASPSLELARFGPRASAFLFDLWLGWVWGRALQSLIARAFGDPEILGPLNLSTGVVLAALWAYFVVATRLTGATLGKRAFRLRVVTDEYERPDWSTVFYREVVGRTLAGASLMIGYLWAAFDKNRQGWHDKVADTYVMKKVRPIPVRDPWDEEVEEADT